MQNNFNDLINAIFNAIADHDSPTFHLNAQAEFDRLSIAAQVGDRLLFQQLLEAEMHKQRRADEPTLLISAVMAGRPEIVQALIDAGADVNAQMEMLCPFSALEFAIEDGHTEIVKLLLQAGASFQVEAGFCLLVDAAERSNADIVQLLIDAGLGVNAQNDQAETPLTVACRSTQVEIVQTLIAAGADVHQRGWQEMMPIVTVFYAVQSEFELVEVDADGSEKITQIVQQLITAGANLNDRDVLGKTPLMLAIEHRNFEAATCLIQAGADVNAIMQVDEDSIFSYGTNQSCQRALHLAIAARDLTAIEFLLEAGADPTLPNSDGITAFELATQKGLAGILQDNRFPR
jgi:hypothetical protein